MNSSKSKTQSSSSTYTNNETNTLNSSLSGDVEERGIGVSGEGNTIIQNIVSDGAFEVVGKASDGAFEVVSKASDGAFEVVSKASDGAYEVVGKTIEGVGGIITELLESQAEVMGSATALAETSVMNMAASTGAAPVEAKAPMTEKTKIALGVSAAVAVMGTAWAFNQKGGK